MKVICQNCFEILADRDKDKLRYDPRKVETEVEAITDDECLLSFTCPKCGCVVQVKT